MQSDFVARCDDPARLVGIDQRTDRGHEERRGDAVSLQHIEDARRADASAELTPRQPTDCSAAGAELERFMIAIE